MSERIVTVGILGGGNCARTVHIPNLRRVEGVRLVAVSSDNLQRRQACRDAWGGPLCFYEDPLELWRPLAPDATGRAIADASHFLVEDQPEAVAQDLLGFFGG